MREDRDTCTGLRGIGEQWIEVIEVRTVIVKRFSSSTVKRLMMKSE